MPHATSDGQTSLSQLPPVDSLTIPDSIKRLTSVSRDLLLGLVDYSYLTDEQVTLLYTAVVKEFFLTTEVFERNELDVTHLKKFPDALRDALESVLERVNTGPQSVSNSTFLSSPTISNDDPSYASISSLPSHSSSCTTLVNEVYEVSAENINKLITELIKNLQLLHKSSSAFRTPIPFESTFLSPLADSVRVSLPPTSLPVSLSIDKSDYARSLSSPKSSKATLRRVFSEPCLDSSVYLFLEWSKTIKKIKLHTQQIDFPLLYQLFYSHFSNFPPVHRKLNTPKLYIRDPQSHVYYELEDLEDVAIGSLIRMEPFEFTPPRLHLDLLRSPSIQQKNPLRTIQHLRLQLIDIRDEVLQFQKEHQAWCQESHQVFCKQLQAPFYFLPNLPDLPSTDHVKNMIEPLYLISEQVRYDLCERQRLPDEIYLNYLSENLEPPDILCHTFLNEVQTLRNSLKPYWSSLVKKVVFQQTQLKDLEKTIVEYQSMMNHMKEVHLKLKRTLSLGNETSWSPKKFQLPSFDPNGQDFNCVIQEIKLIQVDSNQRMFLIDAFEKLAKYKKSQVHLSAFERELNERVQKDFNIKSIEVLEANREKKNQQHLSIIWELRQKHRTEIQ